MDFSMENLDSSSYLVVELPSNTEIDTMALGMITNNKISGLAAAVFMQVDNVKYVKYNVTSLVPLKELFAGAVNRKKMLTVFKNICNALSTACDYMIDLNSIYYDLNYIYVDSKTYDVKMICIPIVDVDQPVTDICMLFKEIMFSAQFDTGENGDYVGKIINYLNGNAPFVIEEFKALLTRLESEGREMPSQVIAPATPKEETAQADAPTPIQPTIPTPIQSTVPQNNLPQSNASQSVVPQDAVPQKVTPIAAQSKKETIPPISCAIPGQNMQVPVKNATVPQTGIPQASKPQAKEKKGFHLFGKKQSKVPVPEMPTNPKQPEVKAVVNPIPAPAAKANFGETTVLGASGMGETTVLSAVQMAQPYIIRLKTNERIAITKPIFRIGKEKSCVDYFIGDNTAISRSHANIIIRDGKYYIVDTHSTNHTYINGQIVASDTEKEITNGTRFRLANEDFEFRAF